MRALIIAATAALMVSGLSGCIPMLVGGLATYAIMKESEDDQHRETLIALCGSGDQAACTALSGRRKAEEGE